MNQYLAAGNVLPTDIAWQDVMVDWVPVTAIPGVMVPPGMAAPAGSKKGLIIGLSVGGGVLLIGLVVMLLFFGGVGGASTSQALGEIIFASLKDGDFEKFKKASVLGLEKDQVKKLLRGMREATVAKMEKEAKDDPFTKEMIKK